MIAGETENIIAMHSEDTYYDDFLGFGKKKRKTRTPAEIATRKEKRKNFWSGVKREVKDSGGVEGVASSVSNIFGLFKKDKQRPQQAYDFQVGVGQTNTQQQDKKVPVAMYVVGGAVVIGLAVWGMTQMKKNKSSNVNTPVN